MGIFSRKLNSASIGLLYRQLAIMIASDVPLSSAMKLLADESENRHIRRIAAAIAKEMQNGGKTRDIFLNYPKIFNEFIIDMLQRKTEKSKVSNALIQVADAIEDTGIIRAKLARALFFPVLTLIIGFILLMFIVVFVLPVFQDMFAGMGRHLPGPTQLVLTLGNWMGSNFLYIIAVLIAFMILMKVNKRIAYLMGGLVPGYRKLSKQSSIISFSKHLPVMLSFDLPAGEAMHKAASSVKNRMHAGKLFSAAATVTDIKQMDQALLSTGIFSKITLQMIGYGIRSNTLTLALDEMVKYYEKDFDRSFNRFLGVLEILAILFTGSVIGYIIIALYLPIFRMAGSI
jgi:type IV pilus assembly protein PilC